MHHAQPRAAYTLIEMIVAVAIITLVLLVVVTNLDGITPSSRLSSGAREVAAEIRLAGSLAATSGYAHSITYHLAVDDKPSDLDEYWIVVPFENEEDQKRQEEKKKERRPGVREDDSKRQRFIRQLPDGVRIKDLVVGNADVREKGEHKLEFSPLGIAPAHTLHLQYGRKEELQITISVNIVTGEPWIREGYREPLDFVKAEAK